MSNSGAKTYLKINDTCVNAYYRYGLTGTFLRSDGRDMVMHGVLSQILYKKTTSELIEEGHLVRPWIDMYQFKLKDYDRMSYLKAYEKACLDEDLNNFVADKANDLIDDGLQTLILVRRVEHGRILEEKIPDAIFLHGSLKQKYRDEIKEQFSKKKIKAVIATNIFGEGTDIPSIEALVNARYEKTEIQTKQGIGRALRKADGKDEVRVVDFILQNQKHLQKHSMTRLETYRKESAFRIKLIDS